MKTGIIYVYWQYMKIYRIFGTVIKNTTELYSVEWATHSYSHITGWQAQLFLIANLPCWHVPGSGQWEKWGVVLGEIFRSAFAKY
jgi:hypothetical protein